jgi:hypothetical protein
MRKPGELDPRSVTIDFAPEVRRAFGDLAAAVDSSNFDADIHDIVRGWAASEKPNVYDVLTAFPRIAAETFEEIHATGNARAENAWLDLSCALIDRGFTLDPPRLRNK